MRWTLPVIDVAPLVAGAAGERAVAEAIGRACREAGFFYVVGHGVDPALGARLEALSRRFFAQDLPAKQRIRMSRCTGATCSRTSRACARRCWRGSRR